MGSGIVGLATARQLLIRREDLRVTVLEKEPEPARHQTGRNSGVVHAGIYYRPGSLKARLCRSGMELLRRFCLEEGLPYVECGKVIVAAQPAEVPLLEELLGRARANRVPGVRRLSPAELRSVEPHVRGVGALHSPHTAITDFRAVALRLAEEVESRGGGLLTGVEVDGLRPGPLGAVVRSGGDELGFDRVVVCAGLQADRLARRAGASPHPAIVPFRGEYLLLRPERRLLVRGLVYPVPDRRYPFLGIHATRTVVGEVMLGPNAVLALAREGYDWRTLSLRDLTEVLAYPGFRRLAARHWRAGVAELARSLSRRAFVRSARRLLPELEPGDVLPGPSGVRAQAVDRDGSLVDDFRIERREGVILVRNAPSPAATACLAIGRHLADLALDAAL